MSTGLDLPRLREWIGRREEKADILSPQLVAAFSATILDVAQAAETGDAAPAGIHWCLAQPTAPMSGLGEDGHPARGGFLPPVPLPRRMWAGSRVTFGERIRIGDAIERTSTVKEVQAKTGTAGQLCFVTVEHVLTTERREVVREEQDLVYRQPPAPRPLGDAASAKRPTESVDTHVPDLTRTVEPSPVLLFRYSALTFNGHRIHYDRPYATGIEGYGGLVVHGPLQATLLLHLSAEMNGGVPPRRFSFRALRPLLDTEPIVLSGRRAGTAQAELWTGPDGNAPFVSAQACW